MYKATVISLLPFLPRDCSIASRIFIDDSLNFVEHIVIFTDDYFLRPEVIQCLIDIKKIPLASKSDAILVEKEKFNERYNYRKYTFFNIKDLLMS